MEGVGLFRDKVQNVWGKQKEKKKKQRLYNNTNPKKMGPMAACIKRGLSPAQKKRGKMSIKRSLRAGLRPRVKNAAGPFLFKPRFLKTGL